MKMKINTSAGFSFVELMVVIALVGALSAVALPNFLRNLPEKRLKNAARNVFADMQKARLQAVKENREIVVSFDAAGTYHFEDEDGNTVWEGERLSTYGDAAYGCSFIADAAVPDTITYTHLGETVSETDPPPPEESIYLQSPSAPEVCYEVIVARFGSVSIERHTK